MPDFTEPDPDDVDFLDSYAAGAVEMALKSDDAIRDRQTIGSHSQTRIVLCRLPDHPADHGLVRFYCPACGRCGHPTDLEGRSCP